MRIAPSILVVLAACGGDSGPPHWNTQPLETVEATHEGQAFTIQLPKGMKKSSVESKYSVEWGYRAKAGGEERVFAPSISVSKASRTQTLDEAIKSEPDVKAPTDIVFKEETANGWVFALENSTYKGKEDYVLRGQANGFRCTARVYPMKQGGKAKDDIPAVAKMCLSIQPKG